MITSTDGQSPYNALIAGMRTQAPPSPQSAQAPTELALATPPGEDIEAEGEFSFFGDDGFTFGDLIDVINPLQHIPLVSTMYREASEDTIDAGSRIMGSTLFFGPIGLASAVTNVLIEEGTGQDIGEHIAGLFKSDDPQDGLDGQETDVAEIAAFETAAGASEDIDPVSAWAVNEMAWRRDQQVEKRPPLKVDQGQALNGVPDANAFLQPSYGELAAVSPMITAEAARSAAWAYDSAAELALQGS